MKKLAIICLVALATSASAKDMLTTVQGKWKLDVAATKAHPVVKKKLDAADQMAAMLLAMMAQANFEFTKDSLKLTAAGQAQEDKFKVLKNTADQLVIRQVKDGSAKEDMTIKKKGNNIILNFLTNGKPSNDMLPLVLKPAK